MAASPPDAAIGFVAGLCYGLTSVTIGQPLDTFKTILQTSQAASARLGSKPPTYAETFRIIRQRPGGLIFNLYRGGVPVALGGGFFRSAQFGVYNFALEVLHHYDFNKENRVLGIISPTVVIAGLCGGVGRALIEQPTDFIKVRRQVGQRWALRELYSGASVTMGRNACLFGTFATYMDITKTFAPGLGAFWVGAISANMAWLTVWPLDVVKSRRQSGMYPNATSIGILVDLIKSRSLFTGIVPGLVRSTFANGISMMVYTRVQTALQEWRAS